MADRQESALDTMSDCAWVRALDASGNSIRISKADLVELVRANMPVVTYNANGIMASHLFNQLKVRNLPYSLGRNNCCKIGELGKSKSDSFTLLLTGASHYGVPATYIVEYGGSEDVIYSILCSPKTTELIDEYFGEIVILENIIYMCTNNYVDYFRVFVLDSLHCTFYNDTEIAPKPIGGISSRNTVYSIINT